MAGYSRIYCVGGPGGFQGADGINPIRLQLWVGDGDRQWWEARYFEAGLSPLGQLKVLIPEGPEHPDTLLDALLAFHPGHFSGCPSLAAATDEIGSASRLELDGGVPSSWASLRSEGRPLLDKLHVFRGELEQL